jgi:hypothetical protein
MHEECPVRDIYDLDSVDVGDRGDYLLIVRFARGVHGDVANKKIFPDTDDVDTLDVTTGEPDGGRDLSELSGFVMDLYAKGQAVARVRCRCSHNYKKYDEKKIARQMKG